MFPRKENRNEGTFGIRCSPGTRTGTRVHSPKPPFYKTALVSPGDIRLTKTSSEPYTQSLQGDMVVAESITNLIHFRPDLCICNSKQLKRKLLPTKSQTCSKMSWPAFENPILFENLSKMKDAPQDKYNTIGWRSSHTWFIWRGLNTPNM